jgi:DNA-binding NtrC family response regulator
MSNHQIISNTIISLPDIADEALPSCPMALVVDDDEQIRILLTKILCSDGCIVLATDNAETAFEFIHDFSDRLSIVISDIQMAGKFDGLELFRRVKQSFPDLGLVAISGDLNEQVRGKLDGLGVFAFRKPFDVLDLLAVVKSLLPQPLIETTR